MDNNPRNDDGTTDVAVHVAVRVRPVLPEERQTQQQQPLAVCAVDDRTVRVESEPRRHVAFDQTFGPQSTQHAIFNAVARPLVHAVVDGTNACLMAYGQTGSGKTYTMFGDAERPGLVPRSVSELFACLQRAEARVQWNHVELSYVQIYLDSYIQDLLEPSHSRLQLRGPVTEQVVEGLSRHRVSDADEVARLIRKGERRRVLSRTAANATSSRSHTFVILRVVSSTDCAEMPLQQALRSAEEAYSMGGGEESRWSSDAAALRSKKKKKKKKKNSNSQGSRTDGSEKDSRLDVKEVEVIRVTAVRHSVLTLVDLAGSERAAQTQAQGLELDEAKTTNRSLAALGNVIAALGRGDRFVPWNNSKLSRVLRSSIGDKNAMLRVVINVRPCILHRRETVAALRFGQRAMAVHLTPQPNAKVDPVVLARQLQVKLEELLQRSREQEGRHQEDRNRLHRRLAGLEVTLASKDSELARARVENDRLKAALEETEATVRALGAEIVEQACLAKQQAALVIELQSARYPSSSSSSSNNNNSVKSEESKESGSGVEAFGEQQHTKRRDQRKRTERSRKRLMKTRHGYLKAVLAAQDGEGGVEATMDGKGVEQLIDNYRSLLRVVSSSASPLS